MNDLIADFLAEARVELDRVTDALTRLTAGQPLAENLWDLSRGSKAIRARAGAVGLARVAALAAGLEAALERRRHGEGSEDFLRALTRAIDRLTRLIAMIEASGAEPAGGDPDLIAALGADGEARGRQERLASAVGSTATDDDIWSSVEEFGRRAAEQMNKNIALSIEPSARSLPIPLVCALRGALTRVIRFACVYGVELEAIRRARGKRAAGAIRISGLTVGLEAVIAVSDDGAGLDLERIRARAVALKLASRAEAANMSDIAAAALIFAPGLSSFGERSGEAGLDRAKAEIERLGGALEVNSLFGRGATFLLRAPLAVEDAPLELMGAGR